MNCPYCGGFNADDRKVCRFCETPLPKEDEVPKVIVVDGPRATPENHNAFGDIVDKVAPYSPPPAEDSAFGANPEEELMSDMAKSRSTAIALCVISLVTGIGGLHRFYLGHMMSGVVHLLTSGIFRIGTFIDLLMISSGKLTDANDRNLRR